MELKTGDKAPAFCLPDKDGQDVCLKDLKGKWTVLYFYPRDNTSGCTLEAVDFSSKLNDFRELGTEIYGVSKDSLKSHCSFAEKHSINFRLLSDPELKVLIDYGAYGTKKMYGKEVKGTIRSTFIIDPELKIAYSWKNVKVKDHAQIVYKTLTELKK